MENTILEGQLKTFTAPSGATFTIREQNGADDDVLSNPSEAKTLANISRFISRIVVDSSLGKITMEKAHNLPSLDRYAILVNSRIHSMGESLEFEYDWGENGGKQLYEQSLEEYLFDYSQRDTITEEELAEKPNAIPFYPLGDVVKDIPVTTRSGKELIFDVLTGVGEATYVSLPLEKRTKNAELLVRNLRYRIPDTDKWEVVKNFELFSYKDMVDIRSEVARVDPSFIGRVDITNPEDPTQTEVLNLVGIPSFFFPGEI